MENYLWKSLVWKTLRDHCVCDMTARSTAIIVFVDIITKENTLLYFVVQRKIIFLKLTWLSMIFIL